MVLNLSIYLSVSFACMVMYICMHFYGLLCEIHRYFHFVHEWGTLGVTVLHVWSWNVVCDLAGPNWIVCRLFFNLSLVAESQSAKTISKPGH